MKPKNLFSLACVALLSLLSTLCMASQQADAAEQLRSMEGSAKPLQFDIAESMTKFVFDEAPLLPSGMPAYGNPFITQGYIYPHGTLEDSSGVLPDGRPEFPELVLGEWTCRGYLIGNGAETTTGPWVVSTQHYDFYEKPGFAAGKQSSYANLVSDGYELADVGVEFSRVVTGGTGQYRYASGEIKQTLLGFNATEGVRLRVSIELR